MNARPAIVSGSLALLLVASTACGSSAASAGTPVPAPDARNATYRIDKDVVTLANGRLERDAAPGSATKIVTTLVDPQTTGDVDGDARSDTVVILVNQPGGSGSFYYLAVLMNTAAGVTATPAMLIGDRIVVTALRLEGRTIVVEYLDHASGQPLAASPTVTTTKRFVVDAGALRAQ